MTPIRITWEVTLGGAENHEVYASQGIVPLLVWRAGAYQSLSKEFLLTSNFIDRDLFMRTNHENQFAYLIT
jgi:hypothetical protein